MAGFFDSLMDSVDSSLDDRMGDRPGETPEQTMHRKAPFTSYVDDTIGNIPQGLMNLGQGAYEAATHPRQTAENLAHYATHPSETASNIYQHYANRYGNMPKAIETFRQDPVGVAGDVLPLLGLRNIVGKAGSAARNFPRGGAERGPRSFADAPMGQGPMGGPGGNVIEGEFTEVPASEPSAPHPQLGYKPTPQTGGWENLDVRRPGRTEQWRERVFQDPRLDPNAPTMAEEQAAISAGRAAPKSAPEMAAPVRKPYDPTRVTSPVVQNYWERLGSLPEKTRADILSARESGVMPNAGRMNFINPALAKRNLSMAEILAPTDGTLSPGVYSTLTRERLSGVPMNAREKMMTGSHLQTFRPVTDADISSNRMVRSPLASGLNDPHLQVSDVNAPIAARKEAEAAKAERIAKMSPQFRENMEAAAARKRQADEDALMVFRAGRKHPGSVPESARNRLYLEEELPVPYKRPGTQTFGSSENVSPVIEQLNKKPLFNKAIGIAGALGGAGGGIGHYLAHPTGAGGPPTPSPVPMLSKDEQTKYTLPDMDILRHKPSKGPTVDEMAKPTAAPESRPPVQITRKAAPATATPHRTAPHRTAPHRGAPGRGASNQKYWGDYRDVEPFASDPIGSFIDELTGQTKQARRPGKINQGGGSLGDLLPFNAGGVVRQPHADGNAVEGDRIPIVSDITDAFGSLMGGGDKGVVARDETAPSGGESGGGESFFDRWMNNPLSQFLFATGIGSLASQQTHPLMALGEGGLRGLEYMQSAQANLRSLREKEAERADKLRERRFLENLPMGDEETPSTPPAETGTPKKTAGAPVPETPEIAPKQVAEGAPETAPETSGAPSPTAGAPKAPSIPATAANPVVASDDQLDRLYREQKILTRASAYVHTPEGLANLRMRLQATKDQIARINQQRAAAQAAVDKAQARDLQERGLGVSQERLELEKKKEQPDYQRQQARIKKAAEEEPKLRAATQQQATNAEQTLRKINEIKSAYKNGDVNSIAFIQNMKANALGILRDLGGEELAPESLKRGVAATSLLESLGVADLMQKIGGSLGNAVSEGDRITIAKQAIGADKSKETNLRLMGDLEKLMNRAVEVNKFMTDYITEHGQLDENYESELQKHFGNKPLGLGQSESSKNIQVPDEHLEIERHGAKYRWNPEAGKYLLAK